MQVHDPGDSLIHSIGKDLSGIAEDIAEVTLDNIMDDGLGRDLPIVGTVVGLARAAVSVRDRLLLKKILLFLHELGTVPKEERQAFVQKLAEDTQFERRVGERLLMLLDRHDHLDKPRLLARIFGAYIGGAINHDRFEQFSTL